MLSDYRLLHRTDDSRFSAKYVGLLVSYFTRLIPFNLHRNRWPKICPLHADLSPFSRAVNPFTHQRKEGEIVESNLQEPLGIVRPAVYAVYGAAFFLLA